MNTTMRTEKRRTSKGTFSHKNKKLYNKTKQPNHTHDNSIVQASKIMDLHLCTISLSYTSFHKLVLLVHNNFIF